MFDIGLPELFLIFIVALLVFGPKKLPEIGKALGKALHELKKSTNEFKQSLENEVGTAQIKEELLKHQRELQTSFTQATQDPQAAEEKKEVPAEAPAQAGAPVPTESVYTEKPQEHKNDA